MLKGVIFLKNKKKILLVFGIIFIVTLFVYITIFFVMQNYKVNYEVVDCYVVDIVEVKNKQKTATGGYINKYSYVVTLLYNGEEYEVGVSNSRLYQHSKSTGVPIEMFLRKGKLYTSEIAVKSSIVQPIYVVCFVIMIVSSSVAGVSFILYKRNIGNKKNNISIVFDDKKLAFINSISRNNIGVMDIPDEYKNDLDVAMAVAKVNGYFISKFDSSLFNNKSLILEALKSNFGAVDYVPNQFYDDKEIVLYIVGEDGHLLWKASDRLNDDLEVVLTAISNNPDAISFASSRLKKSPIVREKLELKKQDLKEQKLLQKRELELKTLEFKDKSIWCEKEGIVNPNKLDDAITDELIQKVESQLKHKLPNKYLELLKTQNGGKLFKRYYYITSPDIRNFEITDILGLSNDIEKGIIAKNNLYADYIDSDNWIIFGDDVSAGHAHYLFDYSELNENNEPKIIYYDNEIELKFLLANSFEEFISNLKIEEEIKLVEEYGYDE